ncbi:MAG: gliding motility protein GldN [Mucilaginibacter sp.]
MKTKILLILFCIAFSATYGQTRRRRTATKRKPAATQQTTMQSATPSTALNAQPAVDTSKKAAISPPKPFDRPLDGYYKKSDILSAKPIPYPNIREADVAFAKRIWRAIDVREKMNTYMASPKDRLIDVLLTAINNGELTAYDATPDPKYDPDGDSFAHPLTPAQAMGKLVDSSVVEKQDINGNSVRSKVAGILNPDSVVKFMIKEDWIFDKQRSVFEPRIIGIAPMVKPTAGNFVADYQAAFWIYFPDARPILATKEVIDKNSDATGLSFDDVFMKRLFTSYIVKQSNEKDERIKDYAQGIDRLYESERIKKSLMDWELNLWQY